MKFVSKHLTAHHLKNNPHWWFVALLLIPIHAAEMHYKRTYHISYFHAKKLFFFDMLLIIGIGVLLAFTVFWFTYDPTVVQDIDLSVSVKALDKDNTAQRLRSGEFVEYTITYQNNSEVKIADVLLRTQLPNGFILEEGTRNVPLADLEPGDSGSITFTGFLFEETGCVHHSIATLEYRQEHRSFKEQQISTMIKTINGSVIDGVLELQNKILAQGTTPFLYTLTNQSDFAIKEIQVPLPNGSYTLLNAEATDGVISEENWTVTDLEPDESVTIEGTLQTFLSSNTGEVLFEITPFININDRLVKQSAAQHTFELLQPQARVTSSWEDEGPLSPGQTKTLSISIINNGTITLQDTVIAFEVPQSISQNDLVRINGGRVQANVYKLSGPEALAPGQSEIIQIIIPARERSTSGTNLEVVIEPRLEAEVQDIPGLTYTSPRATTAPLRIGTNAFLNATIRYYTDEGDQLGRGPLPAQVGEETKYWAFISLQNTSSRLINISFSANLSQSAGWTGRSSVSHGAGLFYNSGSNRVSWSHNVLAPYDTIGLFMELTITPTQDQLGRSPVMLENIRFEAEDEYTGESIIRTFGPIDISLPLDQIGQQKGTVVE